MDRSRSTKRRLIIAALLIALGAVSAGAHLVSRLAPVARLGISFAGGAMMLAGLAIGFGTMALLLFENIYLLLREDGIVVHDNGKDTVIAWGDLERVRRDEESGFVVFEPRDAEPIRWFAGASASQIVARVEEARRKALHGLLKPDLGASA